MRRENKSMTVATYIKTFIRSDISNVADPRFVRCIWIKVPIQNIVSNTGCFATFHVSDGFKNTIHHANRKLTAMFIDKGVLHSGSLAKYFAAFFRISRSSVTRRNSALSLAISAWLSALLTCCWLCSPYRFIQAYKLCVVVPSRSATSATKYPRSVTCLIASILNSSVYRYPLFINTLYIVTLYGF